MENLHVRVTGDPTWTFEMNRWGILFISKKAIELLWASAYGHVAIYNLSLPRRRPFLPAAAGIDRRVLALGAPHRGNGALPW
jgi:hypothetical protein